MRDKEKVYDEKISPLMAQIIQICKDENIPLFAEFQYSDDGFCKTLIVQDKNNHMAIDLYDVLSRCKEEGGVNIDKFFMFINKAYPNKSSIIMGMLNNDLFSM